MTELKSCPFCGGEPKLQKGWPAKQKPGLKMVFVKCKGCGAKTATIYQLGFMSLDECVQYAIRDWNRRAGT